MGVLACWRYECENIMCDRYSPTFGYICDDCFDELVKLGPETNIGNFMNTPKGSIELTIDSYEYFNDEFQLDRGD